MNDPIDFAERSAARARPFKVRQLGDLEGKTIPERDWLIPSVLLRRSITLFAGDGGVGKSLMAMQLQVACALGADWLGIPTGTKIPSYGFYCEDDDDELDRRFAAICRYYGCSFQDVGELVRYSSRVGEPDNELVTFRGRGDYAKAARTATYDQITEEVDNWGAQLIILDTATDIYAGNENIRYQVKAFVNLIRNYALINNGGVILNAHPSKSAMADGSGFSGSTAWNGSVRNRLYLTAPKLRDDEEDSEQKSNERLLKVMKSNYGPFGEKMRLKWDNGVFIRTDGPAAGGNLIDRLDAEAKLLAAARYLVGKGSFLAANFNAKNSLLAEARRLPSCRDIGFGVLRAAQDALEADGELVKVEIGPNYRRRMYIRPSGMTLPGE
jgi:RecA-family ATPase